MTMQPPEDAPKIPLFDVPFMLSASKRLSHRRGTLAMAEAIAKVFTDERLSAVDLRARFAEQGPTFKAMVSELTPEGSTFYAERFFEWLGKTDRWTTERTLAKLEVSLRKDVAAHRRARSGGGEP